MTRASEVSPVDHPTGPLVLLGVAPRSGTNFVYNLLRSHPDLNCVTSRDIPEHFIIRHSRLLARYADTLAAFWGQYWRPAEYRDRGEMTFDERRSQILAGIGRGLLTVIADPADGRRIVTKTPSVDELQNAFALYPDGAVIVVVRDGRSVCESAHKSAGDPHELTMQRWARAVRTILAVQSTAPEGRLMVVRYEDVVADPHGKLRALFEFAGVDPTRYDVGAVDDLPVLGSSQFYGNEGKQWQRVERTELFDPLERFNEWPRALLERFDWVAGEEARALGYETAVDRHTTDLVHRVRSVPWQLRQATKSALGHAQRRLYRLDVFGRRHLPFELD